MSIDETESPNVHFVMLHVSAILEQCPGDLMARKLSCCAPSNAVSSSLWILAKDPALKGGSGHIGSAEVHVPHKSRVRKKCVRGTLTISASLNIPSSFGVRFIIPSFECW